MIVEFDFDGLSLNLIFILMSSLRSFKDFRFAHVQGVVDGIGRSKGTRPEMVVATKGERGQRKGGRRWRRSSMKTKRKMRMGGQVAPTNWRFKNFFNQLVIRPKYTKFNEYF